MTKFIDPTVITKKGSKLGKTLSVMCGVHGNEICGPQAVRKALLEVTIESGIVHFIFANLAAMALDVRQTQMNMNRSFKNEDKLTEEEENSYERCRAEELMPFLQTSDALLDIHSSTSVESTPFIICEPHSFDIAKKLCFPIISHGWDILHEGGTDYFVNKNGGQGICIECGYHYDEKAPKLAYNSLLLFLGLMGAVPLKKDKDTKGNKTRIIYAHTIYHSVGQFKCERVFADFEPLKQGDLIGRDGEKSIYSPRDCVIIFARDVEEPDKEVFVLGNEKIIG